MPLIQFFMPDDLKDFIEKIKKIKFFDRQDEAIVFCIKEYQKKNDLDFSVLEEVKQ